ncbi:MAG TPA: aspartate carbamoyltransferase catalytic subunit [Firmicutes bacterium]|nr:aspartate carbamoyltransferase catalytic subunit [Bacillota bacterium]
MGWTRKHVLDLEDFTKEEIETVLDVTKRFKESMKSHPAKSFDFLNGYTLVNMFFEASTRTRISFELAGLRLGMHVVNFIAEASSLSKGESIVDTVKTLDAMNVDAMVVRHSETGTPKIVAENTSACVLNAGDGTHAHPTQGLLDLFTMWEKGLDFQKIHVAIIGDILHSRVARSDIHGLLKMGAKVTVAGPPTLVPAEFKDLGVDVSYDLDEIIPQVDVLYMLRIQKERQKKAYFPSLSEYTKLYGLTEDRLKKAKPDVVVMHPGPMNRGVEIEGTVADGKNSVILDQVTNGVAVRMALLHLCLKGEPRW